MIGIRRILCPTDFSDPARHALDHAKALAQQYEAELTLLHVVSFAQLPAPTFPPYYGYRGVQAPKVRDDLIRELEQLASVSRSEGLQTRLLLQDGEVAKRILEQAREMSADLVVLGTHGSSGFERLVLGSVTEKVLRTAPCPVLTVPPRVASVPAQPLSYKTIVCGTDFSEASDRAVQYALLLAQEEDARLILLHVIEFVPEQASADIGLVNLSAYQEGVEQRARERLRRVVSDEARNWCTAEERVLRGKPYVEILGVAEQEGADIIVLGVQGRNPLDLMLFGSTTNQVVRRAGCPVLTIRTS
jgi:nucleotide-binding universal stress UspA family protein